MSLKKRARLGTAVRFCEVIDRWLKYAGLVSGRRKRASERERARACERVRMTPKRMRDKERERKSESERVRELRHMFCPGVNGQRAMFKVSRFGAEGRM